MKQSSDMSPQYTPFSRQHGLSLVELMVSLTVGLILLAGISLLIVQQNSSRSELAKSTQQIENGRYAMEILRNDIEHAGFYSDYSPPLGTNYTTPNPCTDIGGGWDDSSFSNPGMPMPISGYSGAGSAPIGCLTNYKTGTAVLVIRRTATEPTLPSASDPYNLLVSQCAIDTKPFEIVSAVGGDLHEKDCTTIPARRAYLVRIYYISTCDVCSPDDHIPTLKMVENGGNPVPLVEGIENMQFDYGVDTSGDGAPDTYETAGSADWANVVAVRVNLLARNNEPTAGYQDSKTYDLGLAASAIEPTGTDKSYKRHVFSEVVRAINLSGRRER